MKIKCRFTSFYFALRSVCIIFAHGKIGGQGFLSGLYDKVVVHGCCFLPWPHIVSGKRVMRKNLLIWK